MAAVSCEFTIIILALYCVDFITRVSPVCCRLLVCIAKRHSRSGSIIHQSRICLLLCQHLSLGNHCMFYHLFVKCRFFV